MQNNNNAPTTNIDLMSADLAADPWPQLHALRELGPLVWHEQHRRWLVTTDAAVRQVALDYTHFTVEGTVVEDLFGSDAFIAMDDRARHNALREVWADAFRPLALRDLREELGSLLGELMAPLLARLRDGETVDLSAALCRPLPTMVIARMMGVPRESLADVVRWSDAMAGGSTSFLDEAARQAAVDAREAAKASLAELLLQLMRERREHPAGDLISLMMHADIARELSEEQIVPNVRQLLFAGNETTAKWLDHIFLTYAQRPAVRREISADRALVVPANEEIMRWQGVVGTLPRRVRGAAVTIGGVTMAEGDDVTCLLAAANRDPARYARPDELDIHRERQPNLGFGAGLHNCLGAALARLEAELAVNALLDAVPDYSAEADYSYSSLPLRGPTPVTITAINS
ncbi:cytochrome P450 [Haliea sp. E17]|uniref:cytochrome P450 n=1 Tax=Haliea sp. E17 TaxID=3401576 RepID=UPI003AAA3B88